MKMWHCAVRVILVAFVVCGGWWSSRAFAGVSCGQGAFPDCNDASGNCPRGQICVTFGMTCECQAAACGDSAPSCNGGCPAGQRCTSGSTAPCVCEPFGCCQQEGCADMFESGC